tara:strand:+ start:514 stop:810 length:297 start_codon:yes stop_codon:yes gene_type:complete
MRGCGSSIKASQCFNCDKKGIVSAIKHQRPDLASVPENMFYGDDFSKHIVTTDVFNKLAGVAERNATENRDLQGDKASVSVDHDRKYLIPVSSICSSV